MAPSQNINSLVGAATRYLAGRNAVQTVYWRTSAATNGRMIKYKKTCEFDKSPKSQTPPDSIRFQHYDRHFPRQD